MILKKLCLHNFRNYSHEVISFSPHVNIFYGDNAQGKSNLLEAIYLLSTGRSFRTNHLQDLIKDGSSYFFIESEITNDGIPQKIKVFFDGKQKIVTTTANTYYNFSSLLGNLPAVLYSSNDFGLINGSPNLRRRFFNIHLAQHDNNYVFHFSRFCKAMKQRNYLLKKNQLETISSWENEMAKSAVYITLKRQEMAKDFNVFLQGFMEQLTDEKERLELRYIPSLNREKLFDDYISDLKKNRPRELVYGYTLIGPHRDDFELFINGKEAKTYASEGQKQSCLISLKLTEWKRLHSLVENRVLMHIDDLAVHLDKQRKELLQKSLDKLSQIFITSPHENNWSDCFSSGKIFTISNGKFISSDKF